MPDGATPLAALRSDEIAKARAITIAILAMGGQGGGVLADWIVDLAEANGYVSQSTSVPGVAQRTGATVYYVELFPAHLVAAAGQDPVLAMMPAPGDVDVVIAAELMEAARAVQRGFVTPDRTVLIASTHRQYAMTEKIAMADGRADAPAMLEACRVAAARLVAADMQRLAEEVGSVISASLFGGLAGSGVLPFSRAQFEEAIRRGGIGVAASLAAFARGFDAALTNEAPIEADASVQECDRIVAEGVRRLTDYQDAAYARAFEAMLEPIRVLDRAHGDGSLRLLAETARGLALWMSYEDTIRVAELKTRASRLERVAQEVRVAPDQVLRVREFLHPRLEEIAETVPAWLGRALLAKGPLRRLVEAMTRRGRIVETTSIGGFLLLRTVAGMRGWRRSTLRYAAEHARIAAWLARIAEIAPRDYALAVEIAECQRLVKGYGETHARGLRSFNTIMEAVGTMQGRADAAGRVAALREAALADEAGAGLAKAMAELAAS
jgi:indolepyruvate ferredoxin oxidoreductase, beta subunit